ncbi:MULTISPECIES: type IIL restriction-modification enzyme MmeI [Streptomyces]|uniref:type IIL restriction-modification enzyme MmeI n=3 Tax=Streptomyces TaxID=1883 RepID=UPI0027E42011|nr:MULTISPECIES: type IIL restriction-modification enzyme MmeI [unclassified Streptomyces]
MLSPQQAEELIQRDPRNRDVLFPYLNGEDLNSRPDCSASRWVINFHDWPEERAREYPEVFAIVERDVKPERLKNNRKVYRDYWWQYAEKRPAMLKAIKGLDSVLAVALVSRTVMPVSVPTGQVFSHMLGVFAASDSAHLALLDSGIHYAWAIARASSLKGDLRYTPSDVYETMPLPTGSTTMAVAGAELDQIRRSVMLQRGLGLTKLYNLVHDPSIIDADIHALRAAHVEVDHAVMQAYDWQDLHFRHDFTTTRKSTRFSLPQPVQTEVIDRLLELNHAQHGGKADFLLF